jgi:hypothetical protein
MASSKRPRVLLRADAPALQDEVVGLGVLLPRIRRRFLFAQK